MASHELKKSSIARVLSERRQQRFVRLKELGDKFLAQKATSKAVIDELEARGRAEEQAATPSARRGRSAPGSERASRTSSSLLGGERASSRLSASRSDVARTDYEQEQLLQELMLKEQREASRQKTMMRKVTEQLDYEERCVQAMRANDNNIYSTDGAYARCFGLAPDEPCPQIPGYIGCNCSRQVEIERRRVNPWTDLEKLIFIDRFLQHPKNFHKIAKHLANKDARDCVSFYYDVKKLAGFKRLLREHGTAMRRRETRDGWIVVVRAAQAMGIPLSDEILQSTLPHAPVVSVCDSMPDISYSMLPYRVPKVAADRSSPARKRRMHKNEAGEMVEDEEEEDDAVRKNADAFAQYIGGGVPATLPYPDAATPRPTALQRALSLPSPYPFAAIARPPTIMDDSDVGSSAAEAADAQLAAMPPTYAFGGMAAVEALGYGAPGLHYAPGAAAWGRPYDAVAATAGAYGGGFLGSVDAHGDGTSKAPHTTRFVGGWSATTAEYHERWEMQNYALHQHQPHEEMQAAYSETWHKGVAHPEVPFHAAAAGAGAADAAAVAGFAVAPYDDTGGAGAGAGAGATAVDAVPDAKAVVEPSSSPDPSPVAVKRKAGEDGVPASKRRPSAKAEAGSGQKRVLQKWTTEEKRQFVELFKQHGRNWRTLVQLMPSKSQSQVKNFYQNNKQRLGLEAMLEEHAAKNPTAPQHTRRREPSAKARAARRSPAPSPSPTPSDSDSAANGSRVPRRTVEIQDDDDDDDDGGGGGAGDDDAAAPAAGGEAAADAFAAGAGGGASSGGADGGAGGSGAGDGGDGGAEGAGGAVEQGPSDAATDANDASVEPHEGAAADAVVVGVPTKDVPAKAADGGSAEPVSVDADMDDAAPVEKVEREMNGGAAVADAAPGDSAGASGVDKEAPEAAPAAASPSTKVTEGSKFISIDASADEAVEAAPSAPEAAAAPPS
uniref:SANT domain-containing protein n=1 Tax=Bicosoecida sp. CB-2014 TaxID=1486930 RepID=A0A7S1G4K6_9STRA